MSRYAFDDLDDIRSILNEFDHHYKEHVRRDYPDLVAREDALRVSSFPYCGLRHLYKKLNPKEPRTNFGGAYYTGVGTVTHEAIQRWLGHSKRILGRWVCSVKKCKGVRRLSFKNTCPICSAEMIYVELEVKAMRHISGHLDGIYKSKDGRYWLVDYKTSSVKVISTNWKTKMLPYSYNVSQITAYCALVELQYDIEISGWILYYVSRDNPLYVSKATGGLISSREKRAYLKEMKTWARHYEHVMVNMKRLSDAKILIDEKPCTSVRVYKEKYKKFEDCPLAVDGTCFDPVRLRAALRESWAKRPEDWQDRNAPLYVKRMKYHV